MKYASIREMDITNGIGIGCSIFLQGCSRHCFNCFNKETWDFNSGKEFTEEIEKQFIGLCNKSYIKFVSILGGEPFDQSKDLYNFLIKLKKEVNKPIYIWSGYTYEELVKKEYAKDCIKEKLFDFLIDGKYIDELKDYKLKLKGSSNQRVIDIKKTIKNNKLYIINNLS